MSKPTANFWHGMGWALLWFGFFGGIALVIWAGSRLNGTDKAQTTCIQQHGAWQYVLTPKSMSNDGYYTCKFKEER